MEGTACEEGGPPEEEEGEKGINGGKGAAPPRRATVGAKPIPKRRMTIAFAIASVT